MFYIFKLDKITLEVGLKHLNCKAQSIPDEVLKQIITDYLSDFVNSNKLKQCNYHNNIACSGVHWNNTGKEIKTKLIINKYNYDEITHNNLGKEIGDVYNKYPCICLSCIYKN